MPDNKLDFKLEIPADLAGKRLDQALSQLLPQYSRARIQQWVQDQSVIVNGVTIKSKDKVNAGDKVEIAVTLTPEGEWLPQDIPLNIIYEDADIIVVNKPAGLVVHPGAGVPDGTLVNALLHYDKTLANVPRAGIVHRLDKDTSGLLVVARSLTAHPHLVEQLQTRTMRREYDCIVNGTLISGGKVDAPVGRHPSNRLKMAVVPNGKPAVTHYRIKRKFEKYTYIHCQLETGRTHQIRVHMAHINHAILGDLLYGPKSYPLQDKIKRQALHAIQLTLQHPRTHETMTFHSELPDDIQHILTCL